MADPADILAAFALAPVDGTAALAMTDFCMVDWAACGIAGARDGTFASWVAAQGQGGDCPLFGGGDLPAAQAALVNGTLSHALDYDDTHFAHIGHPSVAVLPAVFALAHGRDWATLEQAALIGIEGSIRVGLWLGRDHYQIGFHQTATAGAFGATMAAGRLLGLDRTQMRHALGLCTTMASGLKVQFGTMGKPLNAGLAARTGVEAAVWAQAGMTSSARAMAAFADTHYGICDNSGLQDIGTAWKTESISQKFHACCHGLHAMLEALAALDLSGDVQRINVKTHPRWMSVCNVASPDTGLACKFSYQHTAAMAVAGLDTGAIAQFSNANAVDPVLTALRDRVFITADDRLTEMQTRVTVISPQGRQEATFDLAAPQSMDVIATKLRRKTDALVGTGVSDVLWTAMRRQNAASFMAQFAG